MHDNVEQILLLYIMDVMAGYIWPGSVPNQNIKMLFSLFKAVVIQDFITFYFHFEAIFVWMDFLAT